MGFMMPKPPAMPAPPPPPPSAPDFTAQNVGRSQSANMAAALGGTFLTAGQKLGSSGSGKSYLG